jgi:hypothetical protein
MNEQLACMNGCMVASSAIIIRSSVLGLEALEGINLEVLDEGVELVLGVLILVLLSADSHTDLAGHVSNALAPDESVQAGVNTDVLNNYVLDIM